jgi:hypothetical protein
LTFAAAPEKQFESLIPGVIKSSLPIKYEDFTETSYWNSNQISSIFC